MNHDDEAKYLIFNPDREEWWLPTGSGYVRDHRYAGRWTLTDLADEGWNLSGQTLVGVWALDTWRCDHE